MTGITESSVPVTASLSRDYRGNVRAETLPLTGVLLVPNRRGTTRPRQSTAKRRCNGLYSWRRKLLHSKWKKRHPLC